MDDSAMEPSTAMLRALVIVTFSLLVLSLRRRLNPCKARWLGLEKSISTVGVRTQVFPWARATLYSLLKTREWALVGYKVYSKSNQPYIIPSLDRGPVVIIAPKQLKDIYDLPESILDAHRTQNETIQTRWTIVDQEVANTSRPHINVIRNQMTRSLGHLVPVLSAEIAFALHRSWGASNEWMEIAVWDSCLDMIAAAGNATFCGPPLCRNDAFLESLKAHGLSVFAGATIINASPKPLKPAVGSIVHLICRFLSKQAVAKCLPLVMERLEHTARLKLDATYPWDPPKDALQWIIDECYASGQPTQLAPKRIAQCLLLLNVISLHSTSFTLQNVILDLASTDPSSKVIETLREECQSVLQASGSLSWTYEAVKNLRLLDSAVRESMRLTPFANVGLPRTVADPDGLLLDGKLRLPQGAILALPLGAIQRDRDLYSDPDTFKAFRFASKQKPQSALGLDEGFLGFGFRQHACPSRFFALNEIKVALAQMLLLYDIEHLARRPSSVSIMWLNYPAPNATVHVRRRMAEVGD